MQNLISGAVVALSLIATQAFAVDACMTGRWRVDMDDLAQILATQMNGQAQAVSGAVTMVIDAGGGLAIRVNDMAFQVAVPNTPPMVVMVSGYSGGSMQTEGDAWRMTVSNYDLTGSADVLGQQMSIPFSSASGMFGGGLGTYGCSGDTLSFESTGDVPRVPRRWFRISG